MRPACLKSPGYHQAGHSARYPVKDRAGLRECNSAVFHLIRNTHFRPFLFCEKPALLRRELVFVRVDHYVPPHVRPAPSVGQRFIDISMTDSPAASAAALMISGDL
jgi:hypothetical protein